MKVAGIPYIQGINAFTDRDGMKFGIAIHNTSNDGTAEQEASYATRRTDNISAHFYCDVDSIIQSLDTNSKAGHAGSDNGNQNAVAVEITGFNGWSRDTWLRSVAWNKLGYVLAQVCKYYGISVRRASVSEMKNNPKVKAFYGHDDMRLAWGGTNHTDPGPNFPWDRLFQVVNAAMDSVTGDNGMSFNDIQKTDAVFNNRASATLDTDGNVDGSGNLKSFANLTHAAIEDLRTAVNQLTVAVNQGGGGDSGLTADEVRAILRDELANIRLTLSTE